jgi:hypothetical protein
MSLSSCSIHKRLFSRRYDQWVTFSQKTIDERRGYHELLRSIHKDTSHLDVIEQSCERCEATVQTIARST